MSYLVNKGYAAPIIAMVGLANYVLPLTVFNYLFLLGFLIFLGLVIIEGSQKKLIWLGVSFISFIMVLSNIISMPMIGALISSSLLMYLNKKITSSILIILILQLSTTQSIETFLAQYLVDFQMEYMAPAIIVTTFLFITNPLKVIPAIFAFLLLYIFSEIADNFSPLGSMLIISIPPLMYGSWLNFKTRVKKNMYVEYILLLSFVFMWLLHPPKSLGDIYVLLPNDKDKYEAQYFKNYRQALYFSGIEISDYKLLEDIPDHATLLLPWVSDKITGYKKIHQLAKERSWTVILGGEHTNHGNAASVISQIVGYDVLSNDLTTPPENSDYSGPLRSSAIFAWPLKSLLNRGASVHIPSINSSIILAGGTWWAEPNIDEWLWVGDYAWEKGDKRGRLPLAINISDSNANFFIVGDNSFLINYHLIADGAIMQKFLSLSTLWPLFIHDLYILLFIIFSNIFSKKHKEGIFELIIGLLLFALVLSSLFSFGVKSQAWSDYYIGENGFDQRNFNKVIAAFPELWNKGYRFLRFKESQQGKLFTDNVDSVLFLQVDDELTIDNIKFSDCRRLGSLNTKEVLLMDAHACKITGDTEVLIGDTNAAAAVIINMDGARKIVILDIAFLSQKSPENNAKWLLKQYNK